MWVQVPHIFGSELIELPRELSTEEGEEFQGLERKYRLSTDLLLLRIINIYIAL